MRNITITSITESVDEEDVLLIVGVVNGRPVEARGYASDVAHFYPPEDDSHPASDEPTARAMTADEKRAYCERLLMSKCTVPVRATKLGFDGITLREPNDVFEMPYSAAYGKSSWFVPLEDAPKGAAKGRP